MWICSQLGFFSIVRKTPGEFHIRARLRRDLVNLCRAVSLPNDRILKTAGDYRWRIIATDDLVRRVMAAMADSIDYPNFKSRVAARPDQAPKLRAYHDLWAAMMDLQARSESGLADSDPDPRFRG